jgi:hypothetical protein
MNDILLKSVLFSGGVHHLVTEYTIYTLFIRSGYNYAINSGPGSQVALALKFIIRNDRDLMEVIHLCIFRTTSINKKKLSGINTLLTPCQSIITSRRNSSGGKKNTRSHFS